MPLTSSSRLAAAAAAAVGLVLLGGCTAITRSMSDGITRVITPYRVEVVQGNVVTKEQIALIKPGMPRNRVRDLLGSPLIADAFHAQRWDYVFVIRRQGTEPQQRSVTVRFENDVVASVEAPELPSELEFVASISRPGKGDQPKLELTPEERAQLPAPVRPEVATPAAPQGAARTYPPLETTP